MSRKIMQFHDETNKEYEQYNADGKLLITQYANKEVAIFLKGNRLLSLYTIENQTKVGNIYVGKVKNVVKNLDACFVEIEGKEIGYLPFTEVTVPLLLNRKYDGRLIQGDELLVQVQKDAIKTKQAFLTAKVSVSSNYFVFTLEEPSLGVSMKLKKEIRENIKAFIRESAENNGKDQSFRVSCIVRTDAGALFEENQPEFAKRYQEEKAAFMQLLEKSTHINCFACVKGGLKPYLAILERFPDNCYTEVLTDLNEAYTSLQGHVDNLKYYEDDFSLSMLYNLDSKIKEALNPKVWLQNGGYLVIEQTECLTTIDVNSGKMIKDTDKNASIWKLNEEAAKEAALQIRLRNLSGIIIIDFVNMDNKADEEKLLMLMKDLVKKDPVHTSVIDITPLGLMEITRKKVYKSLKEQFL